MGTHPKGSATLHRRSLARDRCGFTLVELVTALVISGIVALVILQLLASQSRFARLQSAREDVQQNTRSVLELITSELRGAGPHGITAAQANSITFRSPRAWGVVCSHTSERLSAIFPTAAAAALRVGEESLAIPPVGTSTGWQFLDVSDLTSNGAERARARAECEQMGVSIAADAGAASTVRMYAPRAGSALAEPLGLPADRTGLEPGTPLYTYDDIRYQVAKPSGVPDWWIRRNTGPAMSMHPLAGPVPETGGLIFRYFDDVGQEITDPTMRTRTRRIEVTVVSQSHMRFNGRPLRDSASTSVFLRNQD